MKKFKFYIRNYFGFSGKETNGFVVLLFLLIIIIAFPFAVRMLYSKQEIKFTSEDIYLDDEVKKFSASAEINHEVKETPGIKMPN